MQYICKIFYHRLAKAGASHRPNTARFRAVSWYNPNGSKFPVREVVHRVLAHLYERCHVLDGVEVLERNLRLGLFGCCHLPSHLFGCSLCVLPATSAGRQAARRARGGVEPWGCGDAASFSRKEARGHGIPDQMSLPMARSVSSSSPFLTRSSLPIPMAGIFCRSMSL